MKNFFNQDNLFKLFKDSLIILPTPVNISFWWNFGSLLGVCLILQIVTGLFLSMHYTSHIDYSFFSVIHIVQDVNNGWFIRLLHMNGASFFFICVYLHIGRGLYYNSFKYIKTWSVGVIILLFMMGTAFLGYVLPWGQMSFWGATVITNLISAVPYVGQMIVEWLWGGFSVENPTLNRFYSLHFLLPFLLVGLVGVHLLYLHETGSNNPLGVLSDYYKIPFHNYFTLKDLLGMVWFFMFLLIVVFEYPYILGDPENFIMADSMLTPFHIQPEWYFLFAYTILRSIPNKLSGVIALLMSILVLLVLPFIYKNNFQGYVFYPFNQVYFWMFFFGVLILTWLGGQPVESPFVILSQLLTLFYFVYFFFNLLIFNFWDILLKK